MAHRPRCAHCGGNEMIAGLDCSQCLICGGLTSWVGEHAKVDEQRGIGEVIVKSPPRHEVPSRHEALDAARRSHAEHLAGEPLPAPSSPGEKAPRTRKKA